MKMKHDYTYVVPASDTRFVVQVHYPNGANGGWMSTVACTDAGGAIGVSFTSPPEKPSFDDNVIAYRLIGLEVKVLSAMNASAQAGVFTGGVTEDSQINAITGASAGAGYLPTSFVNRIVERKKYETTEGVSARWFANANLGVMPWNYRQHESTGTDYVVGPYTAAGSALPHGQQMPVVLVTGTVAGQVYTVEAAWIFEAILKVGSAFRMLPSPGSRDFEALVALTSDFRVAPCVSSGHTLHPIGDTLQRVLRGTAGLALEAVGPYLLNEAADALGLAVRAIRNPRKRKTKAKKQKKKKGGR
jgi:hypothetical protein